MNILGGVKNSSMWLQGDKPGTEEALKFFVHIMGDLPMPLHLTGRSTSPLSNMHVEASLRGAIYNPFICRIVWEGLLEQWADELTLWTSCSLTAATTRGPNTQQQNILSSPQLTDDETVCPYFWAKPLYALNCEIVWPPALDSDDHEPIERTTNSVGTPRRIGGPRR